MWPFNHHKHQWKEVFKAKSELTVSSIFIKSSVVDALVIVEQCIDQNCKEKRAYAKFIDGGIQVLDVDFIEASLGKKVEA